MTMTVQEIDFAFEIANQAASVFELGVDGAYVRPRNTGGEALVDVGVQDSAGAWHTTLVMGDVYDAAWTAYGIVETIQDDGGTVTPFVKMVIDMFADFLCSYGDFGDD